LASTAPGPSKVWYEIQGGTARSPEKENPAHQCIVCEVEAIRSAKIKKFGEHPPPSFNQEIKKVWPKKNKLARVDDCAGMKKELKAGGSRRRRDS